MLRVEGEVWQCLHTRHTLVLPLLLLIQLTGQDHIVPDEETENDIQAAKIVAELSAAGQGAETDGPAGLAENVQVSKKK